MERFSSLHVFAKELDVLDRGQSRTFVRFDIHLAEDPIATVDPADQHGAVIAYANSQGPLAVDLERHDEGPRSVASFDVESVSALPLQHVQLPAPALLSV